MRKTIILGLLALLTVGMLGSAAGASPETDRRERTKTELTLVHGIPGDGGFPVDITLYRLFEGSQRFTGVTFGTVAGPLDVKPGIYRVAIRPAGAPPSSPPALSRWMWLRAGSNTSVVAHLSATGAPELTEFRNDVSPTGSGKGRVTIRHLAQAPAVDVIVNGTTELVSALSNPNEAVAVVPADTYNVSVVASANNSIVAFSGPLPVTANSNTIVYAVGAFPGSFTPLVQVLPAS
jgi:hypothetical protein